MGGWNIVDFCADFFVIWREYGGVQGTYGVIWRLWEATRVSCLSRKKKKEIAAPEFRVWSPTTLLDQALSSLTTVDRTGNGAFC